MLENVNNFLTEIIDEDIKNGLSERIHTRFPLITGRMPSA